MTERAKHYEKVMQISVNPNDKGAPGGAERLTYCKALAAKYPGLSLEIGPNGRGISDGVQFDINKGFLKLQRGKDNIGDFNCLPFKPETFDLVLWLDGPENAINPEIVFAQIFEILKTGGHLIVSCPESPFLDDDWQHVTHFTEIDLYTLLCKYFQVIKIQRVDRYLVGLCRKEEK